jgi:hypothetical protein
MKRTIVLALLALLPFLASAAGTATVRVTNAGSVPITIAGQTIRPSATASIPVPAGEAGAFDSAAPNGFGLSAPASYPSLRPGATFTLRLSAERGAASFSPMSLPSAPTTNQNQIFSSPGFSSAPWGANRPASRNQPNADPGVVSSSQKSFPKALVQYCPKKVRVEVRSRPLGKTRSDIMEIARSEFPVARHDHVFVYDVETGVLVDDIGWTDENGGSAFRDYANIDRYGPPAQTAEISGNVYFSVRDAFEAVSEHFGYQLFNDATVRGPVEASKAVVSVVTQPLKCAHALSAPRREAAILELMKCSLFVVSEAREASGRLEHSDSYNRPGFDSKNLRLLVNCQLWARQFVEALKKGDEMFSPSIDFSTLEGLVDQQVAYVRGLLAAGRKATREQFDEFNSLSERYGKEFDRLRAEILAMTDDARKRECLQRLVSINGRIGKELDPLLDQAERKGLFKNLSAVSSPSPKPVAKPKPAPVSEPMSNVRDWTGKPIPQRDLDAINSLNDW